MLSSLRFIIGAILAGATLYVSALGLLATARLRHMAKAGPIEVSRNLLFDDRADWNQFYDADGARRFEKLARKSNAPEPAETSVRAAPGTPEQAAAPETSDQPAAEKPSEERPANRSERKPSPVTAATESKPSDPDDGSAASRPPASTSAQVLNGQVLNNQVLNNQVVIVPGELIAPEIADTPPAIPVAVTPTTAPATSLDRPPAEPPVAQTATNAPPVTRPDERLDMTSVISATESAAPQPTQPSPPVRHERPLVIAPLDAPEAEERETSAPATAGSVIAPHVEPAPVAPAARRAAAPGTDRSTRPRKTTLRARPARDPDADEPAPKARVAKRRHVHVSRPVAHEQYQYAQPYWQPY